MEILGDENINTTMGDTEYTRKKRIKWILKRVNDN